MGPNVPLPSDAAPDKRTLMRYALVALFGKALFTGMLIIDRMHSGPYGALATAVGDSGSYLGPIESLLAGNGYDPDFRMPGYGSVYLLFRLFFSPQGAGTALVIAQTLTDAITMVLLAITAFRLSGSWNVFRSVFWIYLLGSTVSTYNVFLLTEAFATGALVLCVFLVVSFSESHGRWRLWAAGLAFCWAIFMKPFYLVLLPIFVIRLLLLPGGARSRMARALLFCVPFLVMDGAWVLRNAHAHHRFVPLSDGMVYPDQVNSPRHAIARFVQAFGGSIAWWDPKAEIGWFASNGAADLPPDLATTFNRDSLELVARDLRTWTADTSRQAARAALGNSISARMDRYREAFSREHPWRYHVFARLRMTRLFLVHSGTEGLFSRTWSQLGPLAKGYKVFCSVFFLVVQFGGLLSAALVLLLGPLRQRYGWIAAMALVCVFIFPLGFRLTEFRYLVPAWPWLTMLCCVVLHAGILRLLGASKVPRRGVSE